MPPADTTNLTAAKSEVVSQSEIEQLLALVGDGEAAAAAAATVGAQGKPDLTSQDSPHRYDFPSLSSFSAGDLRKLRVRHEEFIRSLSARLSLHLRLECSLQMAKLETMRFRQFTEVLSNPTHLALLQLQPLRGVCFLDLPLRLGLCVIDRELGGPAHSVDESRDLSKLEARLLSRVMEIIVAEWCGAWGDTLELRPVLLRHENNGRFLQTHPPQTMMLVLGIETQIGEVVEQIQFGFPCHLLEPLMLKLNTDAETTELPGSAGPTTPVKWNPIWDDVEIKVSAEMPEVELTARQLAELKPGDVIPLAPGLASRVQLCLASTPKFIGNLGISDRQLAVQIAKIICP